MKREDYLKDYYKSLEEAPLDVLEEYEGNVLAALDDYKTIGDEKEVKALEEDLKRVRVLMEKGGRNKLCGVFGVTSVENILERFEIDPFGRWQPSYNIRPSQLAPIIKKNSPLTGHLAKFGYLKSIPKTGKPFCSINAKAETVAVLPFFKSAFMSSRCLVPAEFWYEFAKVEVDGEAIKQSYAYKVMDQKTFAFAGIFSKLKDAEGKEVYFFAIITCKSNKKSARVHPRMPVVLHDEDIKCSAPLKLDTGLKQDKLCSGRSARCPGREGTLVRSSKRRLSWTSSAEARLPRRCVGSIT